MPLLDGRLRLAVAVAPTVLQLRYLLARAQSVHAGAPPRPGEAPLPWIVPAVRPAAQEVELLEPFWRRGELPGDWELVLAARPGACTLIDPDWLIIDGAPLGSPREIAWRPVSGEQLPDPDEPGARRERDAVTGAWRRPWHGVTAGGVRLLGEADLDPYLSSASRRSPADAGELSFTFSGLPTPSGGALQLALLSGRSIELPLPAPAANRDSAGDLVPPGQPGAPLAGGAAPVAATARQLTQAGGEVALAPALLEHYPNPFRDVTRVRFSVPLTIGEGLVDRDGATPRELDPQAAIPYRGSPPTVSLKIYSVSGHEMASLHTGALSPGDYTAVWDGTDLDGRPVASGTYFCKLQIERWSVTKQIVFLR
jgi:hypothetical protein